MHLRPSSRVLLIFVAACGPAASDDVSRALVRSAAEPAGEHCPSGGVVILAGVDADGDGKLADGEVSSRSYVCNGADGVDGADGNNGVDGTDGTDGTSGTDGSSGSNGTDGLTTLISIEAATTECDHGGHVVHSGLDLDNSGTLDSGEYDQSIPLCNAAPGQAGDPGADGDSTLIAIHDGAPGCEHGGYAIYSGPDGDGSGFLEEDEWGEPTYLCNGAPGGGSCAAGGPLTIESVSFGGSELNGEEHEISVTLAGAGPVPSFVLYPAIAGLSSFEPEGSTWTARWTPHQSGPLDSRLLFVTDGCGGAAAVASPPAVIFNPHGFLTVTPPALPAGGGTVEACWLLGDHDGPCAMGFFHLTNGDLRGYSGLETAAGCFELNLDYPARLVLGCTPSLVVAEAEVTLGPAITSFTVTPEQLPGTGGDVTLAWSGFDVADCVLEVSDGEAPPQSTPVLPDEPGLEYGPITDDLTFTLRCTGVSAPTALAVERLVAVGPAIRSFNLLYDVYAEQFLVEYESVAAVECNVELDDGTTVASYFVGTGGPYYISAEGFDTDGIVMGTLTCEDAELFTATALDPWLPTTVTLTADPTAFDAGGGEVTLEWTAQNALSCLLDVGGGKETEVAVSGSTSVPLTETTHIVLACQGEDSVGYDELDVIVGPAFIAFAASPPSLDVPGEGDLSWDTIGFEACELDGVTVPTTGTLPFSLSTSTVFDLECWDEEDPYVMSVFVPVGAYAPDIELWVEPSTTEAAVVSVHWEATDVAHCTLFWPTYYGDAGYHPVPRQGATDEVQLEGLGDFLQLSCASVAQTVSVGHNLEYSPVLLTVTPNVFPATGPGEIYGGEVTVSWDTHQMAWCQLGAEGVALSGSTTQDVFASTNLFLSCYDEALFSYGVSQHISVGPDVMSLEAHGSAYPVGDVTVSWSSANTSACDLSYQIGAEPYVELGQPAQGTFVFESVPFDVFAYPAATVDCHDSFGNHSQRQVYVGW